jgi:GPH family glycoside/pentoside/hexuronide:cation symporter
MLLAAIPLALSIGLILSVPAFASPWATFAYVLILLIVLRGSFSAFALPYAALGAELSQDYAERSVFGPAAGLVALVSAALLVPYRLDRKEQARIRDELAKRGRRATAGVRA